MTWFAAALLAASVGQHYPIGDMLSAARDVCATALATEDPAKELERSGWMPAVVEPGSWLDESLRFGEILGQDNPGTKVYAKTILGREAFISLSAFSAGSETVRICSFQDPRAETETAQEEILSWAGRPPADRSLVEPELQRGFDQILFIKRWRPGFNDGSDETLIGYVPLDIGGPNIGLSYATVRKVGMEPR